MSRKMHVYTCVVLRGMLGMVADRCRSWTTHLLLWSQHMFLLHDTTHQITSQRPNSIIMLTQLRTRSEMHQSDRALQRPR